MQLKKHARFLELEHTYIYDICNKFTMNVTVAARIHFFFYIYIYICFYTIDIETAPMMKQIQAFY